MFNLRGSTAEGVDKTNLGIHIHTHTHTHTYIAFNSSHSSYINVANSMTGLTLHLTVYLRALAYLMHFQSYVALLSPFID